MYLKSTYAIDHVTFSETRALRWRLLMGPTMAVVNDGFHCSPCLTPKKILPNLAHTISAVAIVVFSGLAPGWSAAKTTGRPSELHLRR